MKSFGPLVSVIIPTFNRPMSLLQLLSDLAEQSYAVDRFEVVVVDDGSSEEMKERLQRKRYPFVLSLIRQVNQGDAIARNTGARFSNGQILVFIDDDIRIGRSCLSQLVGHLENEKSLIVVGRVIKQWSDERDSPFRRWASATINRMNKPGPIDFTECWSGLLSLRREDYFEIGEMQPLVQPGSSVWCDVDFGFRACRLGYRFERSEVKAMDYDYNWFSFQARCNRSYRDAKLAVLLFKRHPELASLLPFLVDKEPVRWTQDNLAMVVRKLVRRVLSMGLATRLLEALISISAYGRLKTPRNFRLYDWVWSGYIYRGFRDGLIEFGQRSTSVGGALAQESAVGSSQ